MPIDYNKALEKLSSIGQPELLTHWDTLTFQEKADLLQDIANLDLQSLEVQKQMLVRKEPENRSWEPFSQFSILGNKEDVERGKELIAEGTVGVMIIAGGQGTRLRFNGPKGMFPITPITHKSLFEWFCERIRVISAKVGRPLPLAIMTSPLNDSITQTYFQEHNFFGLRPSQVYFFSQQMLPFLDEEGKLFLNKKGSIANGPDGNGYSLRYFENQGLWEKWQDLGVAYLNYILVDNPLADPFDAELIGFQDRHHAEIAIKSILRQDENEKVGVIVQNKQQISVVEYSEFPPQESHARDSLGHLKYPCANLSLYSFRMDFVKKSAQIELPLHKALKNTAGINRDEYAWKFERFIFDLLPHAKNVQTLVYPREECFAPLKNFSGKDSLTSVQEALQKDADRRFKAATGKEPPPHPYELDQQLYFLSYWAAMRSGGDGPSSY